MKPEEAIEIVNRVFDYDTSGVFTTKEKDDIVNCLWCWEKFKDYQGYMVTSYPAEPNCVVDTIKGLMEKFEQKNVQ